MAPDYLGRFLCWTLAKADDSHDIENLSAKPGPTEASKIIQTESGPWLLGHTLGLGSFSQVKLATDEKTGEQTACKIIPRGEHTGCSQCGDHGDQAYQGREIKTAREIVTVSVLHHPNIVKLRHLASDEHHWYLFLEHVDGGQMLDYLILNGKLKERHARKFGRQIASALDYCHQHNIAHRDLKLENILVMKGNDVKIIDFDSSNLFNPGRNLTTLCANHYFVAPEVLQRKPYSGPKVDVWSFGIIMYTMICGRVPFDDLSLAGLHAKIQKGVIDYPSWLSKDCKQLMGRMLVTEPDQRASLQEVLHHPWMLKGYGVPIENGVPNRGPLMLPLESRVIEAMQGFGFGSPEAITKNLTDVISSFDYQRTIELHNMENEKRSPLKIKKETRWNIFDMSFLKQRSSNSIDELEGSTDVCQLDGVRGSIHKREVLGVDIGA